LENLEINSKFWKNRSVFLTGHTGFKGGWLSLWLSALGANVHGYSLKPFTKLNFFTETGLKDRLCFSTFSDIRNFEKLTSAVKLSKPSVVFHMAAQSLVRESYKNPIDTYSTNLVGTLNLFEVIRNVDTVKAIINVTSDKCYENKETNISYKENDILGGSDPYSNSKACSELLSSAYKKSFFLNQGIQLATVRAGNVIGGGDWATDRLVPDYFRSLESGKELLIRSPNAIRPWQHVLDPLAGYIKLAENLVNYGDRFSGAWNFGPEDNNDKSVMFLINELNKKYKKINFRIVDNEKYHESKILKLDISKAKSKLGWLPRFSFDQALASTVDWYEAYKNRESLLNFSLKQINNYLND
jgi:CDP-glucose 4,6-dehydratase